MLNSDEWKAKVVDSMQTTCPACQSLNVMHGRMRNREHDSSPRIRVRIL